MIDTIHMYTDDPSTLDSFDINCLDSCKLKYGDYGYYQCGTLSNFLVIINERKIKIQGSLTKYFLNNNIKNMNRLQIYEAFQKLENALGIPIGDFRISRIDIGVTFEMNSIVANYLDTLIELPNYAIEIHPNESKYFKNGRKTLSFYDKYKECISNKTLTYTLSNTRKLLRYEIQIQEAYKVLGVATINDLYKDKYLGKLVEMWKDYFHKIKKSKKLIDVELIELNKPKDFDSYLACIGKDEMGKQETFNLLNKLCDANKIDRRRKSDITKRIEANEMKFCRTNKYVKELEDKVDRHANTFI